MIYYYKFPSHHCFSCVPQISIFLIRIPLGTKIFSNFFETFYLIHGLFRSLLFNFQLLADFGQLLADYYFWQLLAVIIFGSYGQLLFLAIIGRLCLYY